MNEADRFWEWHRRQGSDGGTGNTQDELRASSAQNPPPGQQSLRVPRSEYASPAQHPDATHAFATGGKWWVPAALAGGPFGVLAAVLEEAQYGIPEPLAAVFVAPVAEEILKIAIPVMLLEHANGKIHRAKELIFASAGAGLMFGLLENAMYTWVYYPGELSSGLLAWRWWGCTLLHGFWSALAGTGAARALVSAKRNGTKPRFTAHAGWLVAAVILHALYNFFSMMVLSE